MSLVSSFTPRIAWAEEFVYRPGAGVMHLHYDSLRCEPRVLRPGDTLTITFLKPHGGAAGFTDPTGDFAYVAIDDEYPSPVRSVLTHNRLARISQLKINVDHAYGDRGEEPNMRKIFRRTGYYLFRVAAVLDVDDPILDGQCGLHFLGSHARHR